MGAQAEILLRFCFSHTLNFVRTVEFTGHVLENHFSSNANGHKPKLNFIYTKNWSEI